MLKFTMLLLIVLAWKKSLPLSCGRHEIGTFHAICAYLINAPSCILQGPCTS